MSQELIKHGRGKDWISWGVRDDAPLRFYNLCMESTTLNAILNKQKQFIIGKGINFQSHSGIQVEYGFVEKLINNYLKFNMFAFAVRRNALGSIAAVDSIDIRSLRIGGSGGKAFISGDFRRTAVVALPLVSVTEDSKLPAGNTVICLYKVPCDEYYHYPQYFAAVRSALAEVQISIYDLNEIHNNFQPTTILNLNGPRPTDNVRRQIENKVKESFCGAENAARLFISFNETTDTATTVNVIPDDHADEKYIEKQEMMARRIYASMDFPPILAGVDMRGSTYDNTPSAEAYRFAYDLYFNYHILPIREVFINNLKMIGTLSFEDIVLTSLQEVNESKTLDLEAKKNLVGQGAQAGDNRLNDNNKN